MTRGQMIAEFLKRHKIVKTGKTVERTKYWLSNEPAEVVERVLAMIEQDLPHFRVQNNNFAIADRIFPPPMDGNWRLKDYLRQARSEVQEKQQEHNEQEAMYRCMFAPTRSRQVLQIIEDEYQRRSCKGECRGGAETGHLIAKLGMKHCSKAQVPPAWLENSIGQHDHWCMYCQVERGYQTDDEKDWLDLLPDEMEYYKQFLPKQGVTA